MKRRATYATLAWAVVLALTLSACGSDSTPTGDPARTANITFKTDPSASVWIDGTNKGTTPIVIAVDAGSHDVVLKADGFEEVKDTIAVQAGKDLTVDAGLMLAGTDVADYKRLLATLGIEHEAYGEAPKAHRGANDNAVMLYWPQSTMRKAALATYRIEVTPDYENDGYIEFRDGKTVLHREKFEANDLITERALPAKVMESLKPGGDYSWGIYFESKRKKPVVATFDLVGKSKEREFSKKIAKVQGRKTYQASPPLMRAMANIDLLRDNRFYSEALTQSLSVLNTWPQTEMPFKSIAFCLERLKLRETTLYELVGESLRGSGSAGRGGMGLGLNSGAKGAGGSGQPTLPPALVAPRVRDSSGGMAPGGMGVTPTPDAQRRQPGPIESGSEDEGASPSGESVSPPGAHDPRSDVLAQEIKQAQRRADEAAAAEQALRGAEDTARTAAEAADAAGRAVSGAEQDVAARQQALDDLVSGAAPQDQIDAAQAALDAAQQAHQSATQAADQARAQAEAAEQERQRAEGRSRRFGSAEEAQQEVDRLTRRAESKGSRNPALPGEVPPTPENPRGAPRRAREPGDPPCGRHPGGRSGNERPGHGRGRTPSARERQRSAAPGRGGSRSGGPGERGARPEPDEPRPDRRRTERDEQRRPGDRRGPSAGRGSGRAPREPAGREVGAQPPPRARPADAPAQGAIHEAAVPSGAAASFFALSRTPQHPPGPHGPIPRWQVDWGRTARRIHVSISVTLEFTPNPDTLKYVVSERLLERGALDFTEVSQAEGAPLAQRLFRVPGVKAVMLAKDFVTVTVTGQDAMRDVNTAMLREIREHLEAGEPVVTEALAPQSEHGADDSRVAQQIKAILDQQVRPAVAMDGGDIVFNRFENGIVYLELKGSCSGCPSSTATLKMGIEQHLRELIPEVQQVEAV